MDKSSRVEKNIIQMKCRSGIFVAIFLLSLLLVLFTHLNALYAEISNFHVTAKDLNLLSLDPLLEKHSPRMKFEGKIDISADIKLENGLKTVSNGTFSSDKTSFSSQNLLFPLEFSKLEGEFTVNTKENRPAITCKIKSDSVKWSKLFAQDLKADCVFEGENLIIKNSEIKIAGGVAHVSGNIDFSKDPVAFSVEVLADGVDIRAIAESWGYTRSISGILFSEADISGEFGKPTSVFGKAKVNIKEGELGKVGWVGRMVTLSPIAALSKDFSLTTFEGDFSIAEGYAYTDNAELSGPGMRITARGDAGWNKKLDFILGLYASSEMLKSSSITRTLGVIIDDFGNVLRRVKLVGTIDNPSFTILPLGIGEAIVEGLQRTFEKGQQEEDLK